VLVAVAEDLQQVNMAVAQEDLLLTQAVAVVDIQEYFYLLCHKVTPRLWLVAVAALLVLTVITAVLVVDQTVKMVIEEVM
jgi:hypothetical protein